MTYLFHMLDLSSKPYFVKPGPLKDGAPSLSNEDRCKLIATRMSVYSFQNENDGPQQNATSAARCIEGVLLPAAVGAFPRCACKFLVPHFSSFGVSKQIMRAREFFPEYVSFHYDSLKRILSGSRRFTYCSSSSSNSSSSSSSNKSSTHHERSFIRLFQWRREPRRHCWFRRRRHRL